MARRVAGRLLLLCAVATFVAAGSYYLTVGTGVGQLMGELILGGRPASVEAVLGAEMVLASLSRLAIAIGTVLITAIALLQKRFELAMTAGATILLANLTTQVLKHLVLDRSDLLGGLFYVLPNSFPSGHATAAASIVVGLILVLPPILRSPIVVLGAVAVALIGASTLAAGWHRMADAVGGVFVATAWGSGLAALLAWRRGVEPVGSRSAEFARLASRVPVVLGGIALLLGSAVYVLALDNPLGVLFHLAEHGGSEFLFLVGLLITIGMSLVALGAFGLATRDVRLGPRSP
ncbi:MAG TPA: phosphatase PAP2 family protein [Candidatus Limnocylindria bacterium]|nr:phosphatase PAP2 family protein [Candidatus Limnocylindria bacterium]